MTPRPEVLWFSERMEEKLQANDHKGHWSNCSNSYLLERLRQESVELERAVTRFYRLSQVDRGQNADFCESLIDEAADVANFAMMIADNARKFLKEGS